MSNHRAVGGVREKLAASYLEGLGYQIISRNFRCRLGEIDLIARDGDYLVFIEVKYRASARAGDPLEAVGSRKQQRIRNCARYYLYTRHTPEDQKIRFDVIGILKEEIRHVVHAFEE